MNGWMEMLSMQGLRLIHGDCMDVMQSLEPCSIDFIFADLPYGATRAEWDTALPLPALWKQYERLLKPEGVVALSATFRYALTLVASNPDQFRYEWVWDKVNRHSGVLHARKRPLRVHEYVLIFSQHDPPYYPQFSAGEPYSKTKSGFRSDHLSKATRQATNNNPSGTRFPRSIVGFPSQDGDKKWHVTQKPVALMEYLIRTYTRSGDTVLDNTCGSGTTAVAAYRSGRRCIAIESDELFVAKASARLAEECGIEILEQEL